MSEAQKNKIDFILNRGKEKSLIFRAAFYWYELDPLYKGITVWTSGPILPKTYGYRNKLGLFDKL